MNILKALATRRNPPAQATRLESDINLTLAGVELGEDSPQLEPSAGPRRRRGGGDAAADFDVSASASASGPETTAAPPVSSRGPGMTTASAVTNAVTSEPAQDDDSWRRSPAELAALRMEAQPLPRDIWQSVVAQLKPEARSLLDKWERFREFDRNLDALGARGVEEERRRIVARIPQITDLGELERLTARFSAITTAGGDSKFTNAVSLLRSRELRNLYPHVKRLATRVREIRSDLLGHAEKLDLLASNLKGGPSNGARSRVAKALNRAVEALESESDASRGGMVPAGGIGVPNYGLTVAREALSIAEEP